MLRVWDGKENRWWLLKFVLFSSGNVVGYHVTQPCESCLDSCNNGHMWMFQFDGVKSTDRIDNSGNLNYTDLMITPPSCCFSCPSFEY